MLVSAQAGIEARAEALENGADDYLVKPFQSRELVARVHKHLQQSRNRRDLEHHVQQRTRELVESEIRYKELAERYSIRAATAEEQQKHLVKHGLIHARKHEIMPQLQEAFIDLFSHELRNRKSWRSSSTLRRLTSLSSIEWRSTSLVYLSFTPSFINVTSGKTPK